MRLPRVADRRNPGAIRQDGDRGTAAAGSLAPAHPAANPCSMRAPADPDYFYPDEAKRKMISGTVLVEATVAPDGRARNPRVWYSLPADVFDEAGRRVAIAQPLRAARENGVAVACTIRFKVRFTIAAADRAAATTAKQKKVLAEAQDKGGGSEIQLATDVWARARNAPGLERRTRRSLDRLVAQGGAGRPSGGAVSRRCASTLFRPRESQRRAFSGCRLAADAGQADAQASLANYLLRNSPMRRRSAKRRTCSRRRRQSGNRDGKFLSRGVAGHRAGCRRRDPKRALESARAGEE